MQLHFGLAVIAAAVCLSACGAEAGKGVSNAKADTGAAAVVPASTGAAANASIVATPSARHEYTSREGNIFYYQNDDGSLIGALDMGKLPSAADFSGHLKKGDRAVRFDGRLFAALTPGSQVVRIVRSVPGEQILRPVENVPLDGDSVAAKAIRDSLAGLLLYPSEAQSASAENASNAAQAVVPAASGPSRPGFDCGKATTSVERMICADPSLGEKDRQVSTTYRTWLQRVKSGDMIDPLDEIIADQKAWVQRRNACTTPACVSQSYDERIAELPTL